MKLDITHIIAAYLMSTDLLDIAALPTHKAIHLSGTRRRNDWKNKRQLEMALLIAECLIGNRDHRDTDGFYLGTQRELRQRLGQPKITHQGTSKQIEGLDLYNDAFNVFYVKREAIPSAQPTAYGFTSYFNQKLIDLFPKTANTNFLSLFQWEDHDKPAHDVYTYIEPDLDAIEQALKDDDIDLKPSEKWHLFAIYVFTERNEGIFPQYYRRNKTNRLYSFGCFGLQSVSKRMRKHIFNSYYCFDMEAAAYNILLQKIQADQRYKYPHLEQYAKDRQKYREQIAKETGQTIEHVKTGLTAMLFGSDLANSVKSDIPKPVREAIAAHTLTQAMKCELSDLRQEVCKARNLNDDEKKKRDEIEQEKRAEAKAKNKNRVYWKRDFMVWLYQTYENKALTAMQSTLSTQDNCLLLHDGLYTKEKKNPADLETAIQNQTGLSIKIDLEQ